MLHIIKQETHNPGTALILANELLEHAAVQRSNYFAQAQAAWANYALLCDHRSGADIEQEGLYCEFLDAAASHWYDRLCELAQYKFDLIAAKDYSLHPADEAYILESECTCQQYFSNGEIVEVVCQNCKKLDGTDDELPF